MRVNRTYVMLIMSALWALPTGGSTTFTAPVEEQTSKKTADRGGPADGVSAQAKTRPQAGSVTPSPSPAKSRSVFINQARLGEDKLRALEARYQFRIPNGRYWYDKVSGAWGMQGGPTLGFTLPGLDLGGPLRVDASGGRTGVFINGRELHAQDVAALQQLGPVRPGCYWLDAYGNGGYAGGPAFFNLVQLAQAAGRPRKGGRGITSGMYDSGIGAVNGGGFISGTSSATKP